MLDVGTVDLVPVLLENVSDLSTEYLSLIHQMQERFPLLFAHLVKHHGDTAAEATRVSSCCF
jgi:hypothetical protein